MPDREQVASWKAQTAFNSGAFLTILSGASEEPGSVCQLFTDSLLLFSFPCPHIPSCPPRAAVGQSLSWPLGGRRGSLGRCRGRGHFTELVQRQCRTSAVGLYGQLDASSWRQTFVESSANGRCADSQMYWLRNIPNTNLLVFSSSLITYFHTYKNGVTYKSWEKKSALLPRIVMLDFKNIHIIVICCKGALPKYFPATHLATSNAFWIQLIRLPVFILQESNKLLSRSLIYWGYNKCPCILCI